MELRSHITKNILAVLLVVVSTSARAEKLISPSQLESLKALPENQMVSTADNKKDTILYFWATWCPDCKEKLTTVFKDPEIYKKFNVYLVATDKDLEKIEHYQSKNSIKPNIVTDDAKVLQKELEVFSVPTFVRLRKTSEGYEIVQKQTGGSIDKLVKVN